MSKLLSQGNEREARDSVVAGKELEIWQTYNCGLILPLSGLTIWGRLFSLSEPPFF